VEPEETLNEAWHIPSEKTKVEPVANSLWAMFKRVRRLEGTAGLYKGFIPTIIVSTLSIAYITVTFYKFTIRPPSPYPLGFLGTVIYNTAQGILWLPATVLLNRATVTPYKLLYSSPIQSLRALFTPHERQNPWVLWLTPGLIAAEVVPVVWTTVVLRRALRLLVPALRGGIRIFLVPRSKRADISPASFSIIVGLTLLSTGILCPLRVIGTRLSIQRNHSHRRDPNPAATSPQIHTPDEELFPRASQEDVIAQRNDTDPYLGLVDCAKRIIAEEGWGTLWRAWGVTLLGVLPLVFI